MPEEPTQLTTPYALVFTTNEEFAAGFLVAFASALMTSDLSGFTIYIGHDQNKPIDRLLKQTHQLCKRFGFPTERCRAIAIDYGQFKQHRAFDNGTHQTYGRHYLASILKERVFLYLDSDMLVLGDLAELVRLLPADKVLAAVQDYEESTHGSDPYILDEQPNPDDSSPYFNAGMLLINTAKYQAIEPLKRFDELRERLDTVPYHDQTYFNILTKDQWHPLPQKWNNITLPTIPCSIHNDASLDGILHFVGLAKPWHKARLNAPYIIWHIVASIIELPIAQELSLNYEQLIHEHLKKNRLTLQLKLLAYRLVGAKGRKVRQPKYTLELHRLMPLLENWHQHHQLGPVPQLFQQLG